MEENGKAELLNVIPKELLFFQVYSDRFEGVYEVNPFLHATKPRLDTTIYLREYEEISDELYKD